MMIQVKNFLTEVSFFIEELDANVILANLISGWVIPENSNEQFPFLSSETITINAESVSLVDVVESQIDKVKSGEDVVVILADNRNHATKMEFFKCNVSKGSTLTAAQIVGQAQVKYFQGENYYDEEIL